MRKIYFGLLMLFTVVILVSSCDSEEESILNAVSISKIEARDVGDTGSAGDIFIDLTLTNTEVLTELRIVLIRSNEASTFNLESAQSLGPDRYQIVRTFGSVSKYPTQLEAGLKDTNGSEVINGVDYTVKVLLINEEEIKIGAEADEVEMSDIPYLQGQYVGTWDDNLYSNFGISASLTYSPGKLSGPFYYSSTFDSCCGGDNDGTITVNIEEDGSISSFRYNQVLIEFMGGCNGTYDGEGTVENFTELHIDFSGSDCEGPHTGGKIVLRKRE